MNNNTLDVVAELLPVRRDLPSQPIHAELMIRDPHSKQVHFFNPTAAVVWDCCNGDTSLNQCEARLRAAFVIPDEADLQADIKGIVAEFQAKGLLVG